MDKSDGTFVSNIAFFSFPFPHKYHIEAPSVVQLYMFICSVFLAERHENAKLERVRMTDFMPE